MVGEQTELARRLAESERKLAESSQVVGSLRRIIEGSSEYFRRLID